MRMPRSFGVVLALLVAACGSQAPVSPSPQFMFLQSARGAEYAAGRLQLSGFPETVTAFSDRPFRIVKPIPLSSFVDLWTKSLAKDSFRADPPNAAISYVEAGQAPKTAIVEITNVRREGDRLTYEVKLLQGQLPATMVEPTLFIDACVDSGGEVAGDLLGTETDAAAYQEAVGQCGVFTSTDSG